MKGRRPGPSEALEVWRFGVVRPEQPQIFCNLHISQRSEQRWDIGLLVATSTHTKAGLSLDEFCASWATLLDTLGDELYERTRPALGTFTNTRAEIVGFAAAIARRRLIIGWRTWFGPAYTDLFGREWLLGIPDTASPLDDGGVAHRLAGSARRLAEADRSLYSAVWPYLERASIQSHWPRPSRPRTRLPQEAETDHSNAAHLERDDVELTALRRDLRDLLATTIVLAGNQRVKVLDLDWSAFTDPRLGSARQSLLLHAFKEVAEAELQSHPDATLRLELGQGVPDGLRRLLDQVVAGDSHMSYVVLPGHN